MSYQRNRTALQKSAVDTAAMGFSGLMAPEHARKFIQMIFDNDAFSRLHRKEQRVVTSGEITKIGVSKRIIRRKTENTDDGRRNGVSIGTIPYQTVPVRLPWEITEDVLRQNIEKESLEDVVGGLMSKQFGLDLLDLHFNGDVDTPEHDSDYDFLSINDGWIKLMLNSGHVISHTALPTPESFSKEAFFAMERTMPNRFKTPNLCWLMSPNRYLSYVEYMTERATAAGDAALIGSGEVIKSPLGRTIEQVPVVPDDVMMLVDPQNLVAVNTYTVKVRKTVEGVTAIMRDVRFYVVHIDDDAVIEEPAATVIMTDLPPIMPGMLGLPPDIN